MWLATKTGMSLSLSPSLAFRSTSHLLLLGCRENFLGHSINAPVGRWQKNKVRLGYVPM